MLSYSYFIYLTDGSCRFSLPAPCAFKFRIKYNDKFLTPQAFPSLSLSLSRKIVWNQGDAASHSGTMFSWNTTATSATVTSGATDLRGEPDHWGHYKGALQYCGSLSFVSLPESLKNIGVCSFFCCESLTEISLPSQLCQIEQRAFQGCSGLAAITLPKLIASLPSSVFEGCTSLRSVTVLSPNFKKIESSAFFNCQGLSVITFRNGLRCLPEVADTSFSHCPDDLCLEVQEEDGSNANRDIIDALLARLREIKVTAAFEREISSC